jgi:hypothetical protein
LRVEVPVDLNQTDEELDLLSVDSLLDLQLEYTVEVVYLTPEEVGNALLLYGSIDGVYD